MSETAVFYVTVASFSVVMALNVVALLRHFMLMRWMTMTLMGFVEQQRMLNEWLDREQEKHGQPHLDPD